MSRSATVSAAGFEAIPASTTVTAVHLTVADLSRSVGFYRRVVGLELNWREGRHAAVGTGGADLVVLEETPGARPARGVTGLFHLALLLPDRADLARWLIHAVRDGVALTGASDHFVSESLYLDDPDGHGIEIYADRPRHLWEGVVAERVTVAPLDTRALGETLGGRAPTTYAGMPPETRMGHVHLRVAGIPETVAFYRDLLGFGLMASLGGRAAFFGAGGYHHHLAGNDWGSARASAAGPGVATLAKVIVLLPDRFSRDRIAARAEAAGGPVDVHGSGVLLRDPSGLALELQAGQGRAG